MKKSERIKLALDLANKGFSESEICEKLKLDIRTMRRYKQENEELRTIINEANNFVNKTVKELIKLATGYYKDVVEYHKVKNKKTHPDGTIEESEDVIAKKHKEWVPGNVQAIKYLLNNRAMERWVDNPTRAIIDKELLELKKKEIEAKNIEI